MENENVRNPPFTRTRLWTIIAYPTEADLFRLKMDNHITTYAYIIHDKDVLPDGNPKEKHAHILLSLSDAKTFTQVLGWLKREVICSGGNIFAQPLKSREKAERYLTHADNPEKYQYPKDAIVTNNSLYWEEPGDTNQESPEELNARFLNDLMFCTPIELARRYGRDYIKNFDRYHGFARAFYNAYVHTLDLEKQEYEYDPEAERKAEAVKRRLEAEMDAYLRAQPFLTERSK